MKNKRIFFVLVVLVLGASLWFVSIDQSGIQAREFEPHGKTINWSADLDSLAKHARAIALKLPDQSALCHDVVSECERARPMFTEVFDRTSGSQIDFILQVHPSAMGGSIPIKFNPVRSMQIMSKFLSEQKYDFAVHEGSGFDGFSIDSQVKEILARLKYEPNSPLHKRLSEIGFGFSTSGKVHSYISQMVSSNDFGGAKAWMELERKTPTLFLAGESIPFSTLAGRFMSGEIGGPETVDAFECAQRIRSVYAVAKALNGLHGSKTKRGAVVYGFKHKDDFDALAVAMRLKGKMYNATGLSWQELK